MAAGWLRSWPMGAWLMGAAEQGDPVDGRTGGRQCRAPFRPADIGFVTSVVRQEDTVVLCHVTWAG